MLGIQTHYLIFLPLFLRGGMKEFIARECIPCDDRKIRRWHEDHLLQALTFFESSTEDIDVTARWIFIEELAVGL